MWISSAVAVQHVGATWLFIHPLRMGYVGAAWSTVWSSFLATALIAAYVRASGLHRRVWHSPNGVVFQVGSSSLGGLGSVRRLGQTVGQGQAACFALRSSCRHAVQSLRACTFLW